MKKHNNLIILLLFVLGCGLFIEFNFRYWYCFMEQYMMLQTTSTYLLKHLTEPGGMVEYVTEFLSMGFFYPLCAAVTIAAILGGISLGFHRYLKACQINRSIFVSIIPSVLLLLFPQETIAHFLTILVAVACAVAYTSIKSDKLRWGLGFVMLTASYLLAAPANIIFALLAAIYESLTHRRHIVAAAALAWSLLLPLEIGRAHV